MSQNPVQHNPVQPDSPSPDHVSPEPPSPRPAPAPLAEAEVTARLRAAGCVFAEDEARIILDSAGSPGEVAEMVAARAEGRPLEHVVGWAGFCGLRIALDPGVFVPRRRTELLVRQAAALGRDIVAERPVVVVDLCCGSGAIGAALHAALGRTVLHAADLDPAAVACAAGNLAPVGGRVYRGDLFAALPAALRGRVDLLAANVPYVPTGAVPLLPAEAREHESPLALDGGRDGLDLARRVAAGAPAWLAPGGSVLVEAEERQLRPALAAFASAGLRTRTATDGEMSATVVIATLPLP